MNIAIKIFFDWAVLCVMIGTAKDRTEGLLFAILFVLWAASFRERHGRG